MGGASLDVTLGDQQEEQREQRWPTERSAGDGEEPGGQRQGNEGAQALADQEAAGEAGRQHRLPLSRDQ